MEIRHFFPEAVAFKTVGGRIYAIGASERGEPQILNAVLEPASENDNAEKRGYCLVGEVRNHPKLVDDSIIRTTPITHYYTMRGEIRKIDGPIWRDSFGALSGR